jgi:hypothetical protein
MKIGLTTLLLSIIVAFAALPVPAKAQSLVDAGASSSSTVDLSLSAATSQPDLTYTASDGENDAPQLLL